MTSTWIIRDWAGNDMNLMGKKEFENFGDAREAITEFAHSLCDEAVKNGKYKADSAEYEEAMDGIEGDLYAVNVDENGNELPNNGQYTI